MMKFWGSKSLLQKVILRYPRGTHRGGSEYICTPYRYKKLKQREVNTLTEREADEKDVDVAQTIPL